MANWITFLFALETLGDPRHIVVGGGLDPPQQGEGDSMRPLADYFGQLLLLLLIFLLLCMPLSRTKWNYVSNMQLYVSSTGIFCHMSSSRFVLFANLIRLEVGLKKYFHSPALIKAKQRKGRRQ